MRLYLAATLVCLSASVLAQSPADDLAAPFALNLACEGGGLTAGSTGYTGYVYLKISGDGGSVQLPSAILPQFVNGRGDNWFPIHDVVVGQDEITAKSKFHRLSYTNHLVIDRVHGEIRITGGGGSYRGACESYDPENIQRAF